MENMLIWSLYYMKIENSSINKYDLEERLVKFAGNVIKFSATINKNYAGNNLSKQIVRSSTSSALNYGEAQGAESSRDFIHKNKLVLKELKETRINLKILKEIDSGEVLARNKIFNECEQLIRIFATIIKNTVT